MGGWTLREAAKGSQDVAYSKKVFRTIWSRWRDVVLKGHTIELGEPLGAGIWNGKGMGRGSSVYKKPGTRVAEDRTTQRGGIPSK